MLCEQFMETNLQHESCKTSFFLRICVSRSEVHSIVHVFIIRLALQVGNMNQILCCDWLPKWTRWSYLSRSGLPAVFHKKNIARKPYNNILYWPSLFSQDGWILASFFFCEFMDLDSILVHTHGKKELGQYPAILTSHLVNNPYVPHEAKRAFNIICC